MNSFRKKGGYNMSCSVRFSTLPLQPKSYTYLYPWLGIRLGIRSCYRQGRMHVDPNTKERVDNEEKGI